MALGGGDALAGGPTDGANDCAEGIAGTNGAGAEKTRPPDVTPLV